MGAQTKCKNALQRSSSPRAHCSPTYPCDNQTYAHNPNAANTTWKNTNLCGEPLHIRIQLPAAQLRLAQRLGAPLQLGLQAVEVWGEATGFHAFSSRVQASLQQGI